mmetsp:Transcript_32247/g.102496  ORF Transcript_32247/g.102496 Transcript_32247/m.102496 type:complete len:106 (+) Transcript_32247:116-433(+)
MTRRGAAAPVAARRVFYGALQCRELESLPRLISMGADRSAALGQVRVCMRSLSLAGKAARRAHATPAVGSSAMEARACSLLERVGALGAGCQVHVHWILVACACG